MERDPVCGMNVEPKKAAATVEFEGKKYFFCAKSCAAKFEKEPTKYLNAKMPEGTHGVAHGHSGGLVSIGGIASEEKSRVPSFELVPATDLGRPRGAIQKSAATKDKMDTKIRYTCPMDPEIVQIGPGTCPKCGMALEPMDIVA